QAGSPSPLFSARSGTLSRTTLKIKRRIGRELDNWKGNQNQPFRLAIRPFGAGGINSLPNQPPNGPKNILLSSGPSIFSTPAPSPVPIRNRAIPTPAPTAPNTPR